MESAISCPNDLIGIFDVTFRKTNEIIINEIEMDSCTDEKLMVFTNVTPNSTLGFTSKNLLKKSDSYKKYMSRVFQKV